MNKRLPLLTAALLAGLLLAACSDNPETALPAEPETVPAAAMASPTALVGWAGSLPASETKEPLDIVGAMPPTSETDEPLPLR